MCMGGGGGGVGRRMHAWWVRTRCALSRHHEGGGPWEGGQAGSGDEEGEQHGAVMNQCACATQCGTASTSAFETPMLCKHGWLYTYAHTADLCTSTHWYVRLCACVRTHTHLRAHVHTCVCGGVG